MKLGLYRPTSYRGLRPHHHGENQNWQKESVLQLVIDYISAGLDPEKNTLFVQSLIPELCGIHLYLHEPQITLARCAARP